MLKNTNDLQTELNSLVERNHNLNIALNARLHDLDVVRSDYKTVQIKLNACADTKKYLRDQLSAKNDEIAKLREELTSLQVQLKESNKESIQPAPEPAKPEKRTYKKRKPKSGK